MRKQRRTLWQSLRAGARNLWNYYVSWEAGQRVTPERGVIPGFGPQDAQYDERPMERLEVLRKARAAERDHWLAINLAATFALYTVGATGMPVIPDSSDKDWNDRRKEAWQIFCRYPDLDSDQDITSVQNMLAVRWFIDGEVYVLLTRSDRAPYRARIQVIETHRIQTPPHLYDNTNIIDGVEVNGKKRPIAYWVSETDPVTGAETFSRKSAANMIRIGRKTRPGQYRTVSFLASVVNDLQDVKELAGMAMKKAKDAADISNVIKNESGELSPSEAARKERFSLNTQTATGKEMTDQRLAQVRQVLGPRTIALRTNEDIKQLRAETPNELEQAHWDIIVARVCAASVIPKTLVFPGQKGQGTIVRAELDKADAMFKSRSAVLRAAMYEIYVYITDDEIKINPDLAHAPKDWRKVKILAPRACNVDVGYNSSAALAELEAGATTYEDIYGPRGQDWQDRIWQRAEEEAFIDLAAGHFKLSPGRLRTSIAQTLKDEMAAEKQRRDAQDLADAAEAA